MGPEQDVLEAGRNLRLLAREALDAFERRDASLIKAASPEVFACADELAKQSQIKERSGWVASAHQAPLMGLAGRALANDFGDGLVAAASRPEWLAARCASKEEMKMMWLQLGAQAANRMALDCVRSVSRVSIQSAWTMAALCAPESAGDFEGVARVGKIKDQGWAAGFAAALAAVLAQARPTKNPEARGLWGSEALALAARSKWSPDEAHEALEAALSTMEGLSSAQALDKSGVFAAARLAAEPGPGSDRALSAARESAERLGLDLSQTPPAALGLPLGKKKTGDTVCWFGQSAHPAWLAAAKATGEHADIAQKMLDCWGPMTSERPKIASSFEGCSHPMAVVWEVWNNSRKAGRALPEKPIHTARRHFIKALDSWTGRVSETTIREWETAGEATLGALEAGRVPPDAGGWTERPSADSVKETISSDLSPLAWRLWRPERSPMAPDDLAAVVKAQALLGYSVEDSIHQARSLGVFLSEERVAELERLALDQATGEAMGARMEDRLGRAPRL